MTFEADKDKVESAIDLYSTTVQYAKDLQTSILSNYQTLIASVNDITLKNSESAMNKEKTGFVYSQRSTYVLIDALLTTLVFSLAIVYFLNVVWADPRRLTSWAFLSLILLLPYFIHKILSVTTAFFPVNVYALWAST